MDPPPISALSILVLVPGLNGLEHGIIGWLLLEVLVPSQSSTFSFENARDPRILVRNTLLRRTVSHLLRTPS
jgi:hypothetical protein